MDPAELERLAELAAQVPRDQAIVELGSYRGGSASALALGARNGGGAHVTCIDPWPQPRANEPDPGHAERQRGALEAFRSTMSAQGWPVTALRAHSHNIAPRWVQPVGLLFIDGDHSYDAVAADFRSWLSLLAPGAWLVFHDYFDDGECTLPGDTARVIDELVIPTGLFHVEPMTLKLWVGRRRW